MKTTTAKLPALERVSPGLVQCQVVLFGRPDLTRLCLQSLIEQTYALKRILVIDNAPDDGSAGRLRDLGEIVHFLPSPRNGGWTGGQNLGFSQLLFDTQPEFYLTVNSDTVLEPDCLERLMRRLQSLPEAFCCSPLIHADKQRNKVTNVGYNLSYRFLLPMELSRLTGNHDSHIARGWRRVSWSDDTVALMRASVVHELGGYDERLFMYVDMTDLAYRARCKGYAMAVDYSALAYHSGKGSSGGGSSALAWSLKLRNWYYFQRKHFPSRWQLPYTLGWWAAAFAAMTIKLLVRGESRVWRTIFGNLLWRRFPDRKPLR